MLYDAGPVGADRVFWGLPRPGVGVRPQAREARVYLPDKGTRLDGSGANGVKAGGIEASHDGTLRRVDRGVRAAADDSSVGVHVSESEAIVCVARDEGRRVVVLGSDGRGRRPGGGALGGLGAAEDHGQGDAEERQSRLRGGRVRAPPAAGHVGSRLFDQRLGVVAPDRIVRDGGSRRRGGRGGAVTVMAFSSQARLC